MSSDPTELVNVPTLAARLGVSPWTIYQWVFARRIPYVKVGRRVMFNPTQIDAWLTARAQPTLSVKQRRRRELVRRGKGVNRS